MPVFFRAPDVPQRLAADDEVLMRDVREAHAEVVDDVVPLPAGLRGDRGRAVHKAVEHSVEPGDGHARVAGEVAALAPVLREFREVFRYDEAVIVQRDREVLVEKPLYPRLLALGDLHLSRGDAVDLLGERELAVVGPPFEVLEAPVSVVLGALADLRGFHGDPPQRAAARY